MSRTFKDTAEMVSDIITHRGYEFGTGRFRDIELVLEIAHALGDLDTERPENGVLYGERLDDDDTAPLDLSRWTDRKGR